MGLLHDGMADQYDSPPSARTSNRGPDPSLPGPAAAPEILTATDQALHSAITSLSGTTPSPAGSHAPPHVHDTEKDPHRISTKHGPQMPRQRHTRAYISAGQKVIRKLPRQDSNLEPAG
jgi:hypothetical protein